MLLNPGASHVRSANERPSIEPSRRRKPGLEYATVYARRWWMGSAVPERTSRTLRIHFRTPPWRSSSDRKAPTKPR